MRKNGYLGTSDQKSDPPFALATSISYKTAIFPLSDDVFGIHLFLCTIFIWPCDLELRPFWPWGHLV